MCKYFSLIFCTAVLNINIHEKTHIQSTDSEKKYDGLS